MTYNYYYKHDDVFYIIIYIAIIQYELTSIHTCLQLIYNI